MRWATVETPIGPVSVAAGDDGVRGVRLRPGGPDRSGDPGRPEDPDRPGSAPPGDAPDGGLLAEAVAQLRAYFTGRRTGFDLPLAIPDDHGSGFERAVWAELTRIPYGEMWTYGEVAAAVGDAGAARAVGTACNRNPIPVIVPCHRVVGAGGRLVGFGGGLPRKRWLLEHEARVALERAWS